MPSSALDSIAYLRRITAALEVGEPPDPDDGAWLAARLQRYLAAAERGLTVETALDLAPMPGQTSWWTEEATQVRDDALRQMAARFWFEHKPGAQAREIERLALRYGAAGWLRDRDRPDMPERHLGTETEWLWRAFKSGAVMPIKQRQLETILTAENQDAAA